MSIDEIISPESTLTGLCISSKKRLFEFIADFFCDAFKFESLESQVIVTLLNNREKLGSTGIGNGVAIPHCRYENITSPKGIFIKLDEPLPFDTPDTLHVDIVLFLLLPSSNHEASLKILSNVAHLFNDPNNRNEIRKADTNQALYATISQLAKKENA